MPTRTLLVALLFVGCAGPTPAPPSPGPYPVASPAELIAAHNAFRALNPANLLTPNPLLQKACEAHATDMARGRFMSHSGSDGSSPYQRMTRAGYPWQSAGENVAKGQRTVAEVMAGWEGSEGHRSNMLDPYFSDVGAACARDGDGVLYFCVDFGHPRQ